MLSITVNYIRSEYIEILKEFGPINSFKEKNGHLPTHKVKLSLWDRFTINMLGNLVFAIKVRKVGLCTFDLNSAGFARQSNVGKKFIPWEQVLQIHLLSSAYLLELDQGFIPLPFRCFETNQRADFEVLVSRKLARFEL
ncbi:MAG: hypothetical protein ACI8SK_001165 [Shewanella sp.]|jgi:hypothetical protein